MSSSLKYALLFLLLAPLSFSARATEPADTGRVAAANKWADTKIKQMSLIDKIGQLMFVRVPQKMNNKQKAAFEKSFTKYHVGGICFFKGTASAQVEQTKRYQNLSKTPLFVTIDGEWGLGMRLTDCFSFPRQMLMGALSSANDSLISMMGEEIGIQCAKMGIHINFAPVCDLNDNPKNPVIGCRSFGQNKKRVARKSVLYALALQRKGVIAVGKHFPGHGDTDVDSHNDLPTINHSKEYIDTVDLYPFKQLAKNGIRGMMVAHLQVNAYDNRPNMPSSLSERIVTPLLRERLNFDGLVFTDGIDMKAVSNNFKDGEGAVRAVRAGCDVILLPIDLQKTIKVLYEEAKKDPEFEKAIDKSCHRILREKYLAGLNKASFGKLTAPDKKDSERCNRISNLMAQKALTLVYNKDHALPLSREQKTLWIAVGASDTAVTALDEKLLNRIFASDAVVISLYANIQPANNYGVSTQTIDLINSIAAIPNLKTTLVIYGSPYILESFPRPASKTRVDQDNYLSAVVVAYQNTRETIKAVPPALYGDNAFEGILPVTSGNYPEGTSLKAIPVIANPFSPALKKAGMDEDCFAKIDSIANNGILQKAYPGCQILVAKNGTIVYNRCYGRQTYDESSPAMDTNTVYDLASLTKITATNLAIMKLVESGKITLDDKLSRYLPYLKHSDKKHITIKQVLSHFGRLKAFDAYWQEAVGSNMIYRGKTPPAKYIPIGDDIYISPEFRYQVLKQIVESKLEKKNQYIYSDLDFILLAEVVRQVSGKSIDAFTQEHFFAPMNLSNTCFQPLQHGIAAERIAPTEYDGSFRKQQLRGYVHDPNAAAMGGVAGHAGLFSTANDLFHIYQMMLDSGRYNGVQYISAETFGRFNKRYYESYGNRRALGFDKPLISKASTHVSPLVSQQSFGHTGFTGTMVWVDPKYNLIYIFLSNRVYPSATPNKLASMNIRTDIQTLIYKSMGIK